MIKKILLLVMFFVCAPVFASENIYVEALEDYSSIKPAETFKVKVLKPLHGEYYSLLEGDILNCTLYKTKKPTRGKRDAQIYFILKSYVDKDGEHMLAHKYLAKYSKKVISIEAIKSTPKKTIIKKAAGTVGDHFLTGVSYGISFVDGVATNNEGNRLKSGAKQVYKDSFLSYAEKGEEIHVERGDAFYLVTKLIQEEEEPNYTYE